MSVTEPWAPDTVKRTTTVPTHGGRAPKSCTGVQQDHYKLACIGTKSNDTPLVVHEKLHGPPRTSHPGHTAAILLQPPRAVALHGCLPLSTLSLKKGSKCRLAHSPSKKGAGSVNQP